MFVFSIKSTQKIVIYKKGESWRIAKNLQAFSWRNIAVAIARLPETKPARIYILRLTDLKMSSLGGNPLLSVAGKKNSQV
jgi:hypothetical protein